MKLSKYIFFKRFKKSKINKTVLKSLNKLIKENNQILRSLSKNYENNYDKKILNNLKKYSHINLIGMGGSILGAKSIFSFLKEKIKKNFFFINNFNEYKKIQSKKKF